jgi:solute carrier family 7 (L-type amino acid transporter), member 5
MSISGLLWLRKKNPDAERPIRVNLIIPYIFLVICGFLVICSFYVSPVEVGVGCLVILSGKLTFNLKKNFFYIYLIGILFHIFPGIPVYYATIHRPVPWLTRLSARFNTLCAKFFLCMPYQEEKEN